MRTLPFGQAQLDHHMPMYARPNSEAYFEGDPRGDVDMSFMYSQLSRRRKAYRREILAKRICPPVILIATLATLGYLIATRMF